MAEALFDPVARFYDFEQQHFTDDIPFYITYAQQCGGEVLEGACGTGRILIPMAQAGSTVTGLDNSQGMLDVAKKKVEQLDKITQSRISLIRGDLTDFNIGKRFALIFIAYRSFQCLVTKEEQGACLDCIRKHLADDGLVILDLFAPRHDYLAEQKRHLELSSFFDETLGAEVTRRAEDEYNLVNQTLKEDRAYEWKDHQGNQQCYTWSFELSYLFRNEAELLLEKHGLAVTDVFGDFKKAPYDYYSGEQVFVARRK
jgi:SAM-dependent methyltransferase